MMTYHFSIEIHGDVGIPQFKNSHFKKPLNGLNGWFLNEK